MPDFQAELESLSLHQQAVLAKQGLGAALDFTKSSEDLLKFARIASLSEDEEYFLAPDSNFAEPVSPRNEAAALSLLRQKCQDWQEAPEPLLESLDRYCANYASNTVADRAQSSCDAQTFSSWAVRNNVEAAVQPATFGKGIRGLAASIDLLGGSTAASVPASLLITHDTARDSDLGAVLTQFPQLSAECIAVIWTMADRHDGDSPWSPFWDSLPPKLSSGLSMPDCLVDLLHGTAAHAACQSSRQHIRDQYQQLKPILEALVTAYPEQLQPAWLNWEAYLWAVQLWYAYAMQVEWPDKSRKDCLVPFASLMNHSVYPHVVRYSKLDPKSHCLKLPLFRPVMKDEQCFLSYGPLSNLDLMLFYGMAIPGNPYDIVPLDFTVQAKPWHVALLTKFELSLEHQMRKGPLPQKLLMVASVLGLPVAKLKGLTRQQLQQSLASTEFQQAQYVMLLPIVQQIKQSVVQDLKQCQQVHQVDDNAMLPHVEVYLKGQLGILHAVTQQIEALRHSDQLAS